MQQLVFHPAWDKTIADQDRLDIIDLFSNVKLTGDSSIQMTVMKQAFNHKEELLITGIVHNLTKEDYSPNGGEVRYVQHDTVIAKNNFFYPDLVIEANTSTPWTFIFPKENVNQQPTSPLLGNIIIERQ